MKCHLTKQLARHLQLSLESTGKGFTIGELRTLNSVIDKLDEPTVDYAAKIAAIVLEQPPDMDHQLEVINETDGQDPVTVDLTAHEHELVMREWNSLEFAANKYARKMVLAIDDALTENS